ncbi:FAD-dependent oxidoreductase [Rubrobacter tropicus]|uniref:FAD-dependent oxidoreductase n=1 Tax=Rubrobacter tropicus TaxID=2653851 RepID=UPI00140A5869|nr:FAD-dependent monooxygenase [Rubrobacter tropicus]
MLERWRTQKEGRRGRAVVIGAGISGLLFARVLSEAFDRVTVVERDALPEGAVARKGVPQARHLHSLAARGSRILEELFPGFDAELAAAGCPLLDQASDAVTEFAAGRLPRFRSGITMRAASRALIERRIRARLEREPAIAFLPGREVVGLLPGSKGVSGVRMRLRQDGSVEKLAADLVVDASGAGSRVPRWLEEMGHEAPKETVVDARLGYATRWYRVPKDFPGDWTGVAVLPGWPETTRGGTLRRVEGDLWTAVLIGTGGDYPPTDPEGFASFASSLHSPVIHDAIRSAEPASPVYGYRRTANRLRHYEKVDLPENLLIAGDAACVLNPSYGQGMTAAALSAAALRECLNKGTSNLSRRFQRRQRRAVAPCWTATTNSDAQWATKGVEDLNPARRVLYRISEEVMNLAVEREDVARTLLGVKNVIQPPAALLRPGILVPALARAAIRTSADPARPPAEDRLIADR